MTNNNELKVQANKEKDVGDKKKMRQAFQDFEGGLFSCVEKADVGDSYSKMAEQGVDLMGWADPFAPDFVLPEHILQATRTAIEEAIAAHYTAPLGNSELKAALANKLRHFNNLQVNPERNILITPGSDSGLYYAMLTFLNEGDEVLIPSPAYPNFFQNCKIMAAKAIPVQLKAELEFQIDIADLEAALTSKTKMLVLAQPNNPTTTVFNRQTIKELCEFVIKHDLILVCDQAFEDFTFENELLSPASFPGMMSRTISVFSVSKGLGLSGYRVGYIVADAVYINAMMGAVVSVLGTTNTVAQKAVIAALADLSYLGDFEKEFDIRRKAAYAIINSIPNVSCQMPQSGFLAWVDVSKLGNSATIVAYLAAEAKVAVNDGSNYGPGGEGHIRIVLGVYRDTERVIAALNRIKDALISYQNK